MVFLGQYNGGNIPKSYTEAGVRPDSNGEYIIGDMILDEFQFSRIDGAGSNDDDFLSAGIVGDRYRLETLEIRKWNHASDFCCLWCNFWS